MTDKKIVNPAQRQPIKKSNNNGSGLNAANTQASSNAKAIANPHSRQVWGK